MTTYQKKEKEDTKILMGVCLVLDTLEGQILRSKDLAFKVESLRISSTNTVFLYKASDIG